MVKADDWIANGFVFDDDGWLTDEGIVRVPSMESTLLSRGYWKYWIACQIV